MNYADDDVIFYHTLSVMSDLVIGSWLAWWSFMRNLEQDGSYFIHRSINGLIYILGFLSIIFRKELFLAPSMVILERLIFSLFFAFIIYDQTFASKSLIKVSNLKKVSYWGKYTYGLYCLHIPAMVFTEGFAMIGGIHESLWWVFVGKTVSTFILSLIFCRISFRFLERPFLRLKTASFSSNVTQKVSP